MTPDQADHLRDLFVEARQTARRMMERPGAAAYAADDAAMKAFMDAVAEMVTHEREGAK